MQSSRCSMTLNGRENTITRKQEGEGWLKNVRPAGWWWQQTTVNHVVCSRHARRPSPGRLGIDAEQQSHHHHHHCQPQATDCAPRGGLWCCRRSLSPHPPSQPTPRARRSNGRQAVVVFFYFILANKTLGRRAPVKPRGARAVHGEVPPSPPVARRPVLDQQRAPHSSTLRLSHWRPCFVAAMAGQRGSCAVWGVCGATCIRLSPRNEISGNVWSAM